MELDKLHVRDNVKLAEVNIKMFLYQDNIPVWDLTLFELWCEGKKDVMIFFMSVQQSKEQQNKEQHNKEVCDSQNWCSATVLLIFLLCAQPYTTVGLCDIFMCLKFFCLELLFKDSSKPKKHQYLVQLDVVLTHWRTKMGLKSKEVRFKFRFLVELS